MYKMLFGMVVGGFMGFIHGICCLIRGDYGEQSKNARSEDR